MVNLDDALNDDLGAVIRTRGDPSAAVMYTQTPFVGQAAMPVVEMLNDQLARRTGLTDAAKGLDPKALQSSTQMGVEAVINGAQERVELVARVLCETGFKDLFSGLYNEICENPNPPRTLRIHGNFVPYDTSTFDATMAVEVNANLGKGSDMVRMMALSGIKTDQQALVAQMGINNPICGVQEMLNTMTDLLALANVKNVGRYFKTPNPQQMAAMMSAPKPPDPQAMAAQAMIEKVRSETAKAVGQQHLDRTKMEQENQFKHAKLQSDSQIAIQKLELEARRRISTTTPNWRSWRRSLMKTQSDSDAARDQQSQIDMADAQQKQDQAAQDGVQQQQQAIMQAQAQDHQHQQNMAKINSDHVQAMTKMAADHHAQMTGHAMKGAGVLAGALGGDADRMHEARQSDADREHEAQQSDLDRQHQVETTEATLGNARTLAKMKPKGPVR